MFSEKEFIKEEKRCAKLLGMSFAEYKKYKNNTKIPTTRKRKLKYDNSILSTLGLTTNDLKIRKA